MNAADVNDLIRLCQGFDNRRDPDDLIIAAWLSVLGDIDPADARQAVVDHYATTRDWIMPADIRSGALRVARRRAAAITATRHTPGCWGVPAGADIATQIRALPPATQPAVDETGLAKLRAALTRAAAGMTIPAGDATTDGPKTRSDEIRERAIARARQDRAGRSTTR